MDNMLRNVANIFCGFMELRLIRFVLVGGVNTLLGFGLYVIFLILGLNYSLASFFSLAVSVIFGFFMQGAFVFGNRNKILFLRFVLAWGVMYFFNVLAIEQLILSGFNAYNAGAMIVIPGAIFSYFLQKFYVFRVFSKNN